MKFEDLGLRAELLQAVLAGGYTTATPVQAKAIPEVLAGHDVLAGAQTGTGKTAAFALPILQLLSQRPNKGARAPRALILTPTRELADQVGASFKNYGRQLQLRTGIVYGGVGYNPQMVQLRNGIDVLVATPGRLLDHAQQRTVDLSQVEFFVLDEADRMLDMGFIHDIRRIQKLLPVKRQTMMFSATYNADIRRLASSILNNPREVEVAARNVAADRIEQVVYPVGQTQKRALLSFLIKKGDWRQVLVFARTKHGANRLAKQLEQDGITASAIHGNKSQSARTAALNGFKKGDVRVLVATDIASRGIDINQLPHVVNYELPDVPEDYVHRIGRTGRAGMEGIAVSLVCDGERAQLRAIESLLDRPLAKSLIDDFKYEGPTDAERMAAPPARKARPSRSPLGAETPVSSFGRRSRGRAGGTTRW